MAVYVFAQDGRAFVDLANTVLSIVPETDEAGNDVPEGGWRLHAYAVGSGVTLYGPAPQSETEAALRRIVDEVEKNETVVELGTP